MRWKENWAESREHFIRWWRRDGLVVVPWLPLEAGRTEPSRDAAAVRPARPGDPAVLHADPAFVAAECHYLNANAVLPLDALPIGRVDLGPGSLALYLGSEPGFSPDTVWFHPLADQDALERPIRFDPANRWWRRQVEMVDALQAKAAGNYPVGMPDLIENLDILSSLRGAQELMMDLVERPAWARQRIAEINACYFEVYDALRARIALPDGSTCFQAFHLWGPGRTAKVQCDALAMISPAMFAEFVQPALAAQCDWLDHAMFHLDGTQAIPHLDGLLAIPGLDAIEYTPQAGIEGGGHERWWPLYRRILEAGKSVQVVAVRPHELEPLLNAIGTRGVYVMMGGIADLATLREVERVVRKRYPR